MVLSDRELTLNRLSWEVNSRTSTKTTRNMNTNRSSSMGSSSMVVIHSNSREGTITTTRSVRESGRRCCGCRTDPSY